MVSPATATALRAPLPEADAGIQGEVEAFAPRMHVELGGTEGAPPLLVLHGWGSSAAIMRGAVAALADGWRTHSLDLPGHGRTPPPPSPWGVPEYAALVAHYVRRTGIGPLPVLGHSNGGRIALYMAAEAATADLFTRLALVSPSGIRRRPTPAALLRRAWAGLLKAPFRLLPDGPLRRRGLEWVRSTIYWRLIASADYLQAAGAMRETFVKTVNFHVGDRLSGVRQPVLVMWGDRDRDVVRAQVDRLVEGLPDARLVVLPGAGHYGFIDAPAAYAAAVRSFLATTH
jgi:pimeloyl-ACP methyl ester carboxylesterase